MSRTERLLELLQVLRRHRAPVSGSTLAADLNISLRTLYRDIATLNGQGADIAGEPGVGYVLRPGFMLPPLMFSEEEIEALVLGSRWVALQPDHSLARAARSGLAKIAAVLPPDLAGNLEASALLVGSTPTAGERELGTIREAIRRERKLRIRYVAADDRASRRTIWPFALGFFETTRVIAAWCESRKDFRHFRVDRIRALDLIEERYPQRRAVLLKEWRDREGIPPT